MEKRRGGEEVNQLLVDSVFQRLRNRRRLEEKLHDAERAAAEELVDDLCLPPEEAQAIVEEARERLIQDDAQRIRDLFASGKPEREIQDRLTLEGYSYPEVKKIIALAKENRPGANKA